jgi:hypothetical protein
MRAFQAVRRVASQLPMCKDVVYMLSKGPDAFPMSVVVNNSAGSTVQGKPQFELHTRAIWSQEVPPPRWGYEPHGWDLGVADVKEFLVPHLGFVRRTASTYRSTGSIHYHSIERTSAQAGSRTCWSIGLVAIHTNVSINTFVQ